MKIYVAHSKDIDYINCLYNPLKECKGLLEHELIFPHECSRDSYHTRDFYGSFDLMIAEVSLPATGLGIELGFVYDENIPIYCLYKEGSKYSSSIKSVTNNIVSYKDEEELVSIVSKIVNNCNS